MFSSCPFIGRSSKNGKKPLSFFRIISRDKKKLLVLSVVLLVVALGSAAYFYFFYSSKVPLHLSKFSSESDSVTNNSPTVEVEPHGDLSDSSGVKFPFDTEGEDDESLEDRSSSIVIHQGSCSPSSCPSIPAEYNLFSWNIDEFSEKGDTPWGGDYHSVRAHIDNGNLVPDIEILPGKYVVFGSVLEEVEPLILGETENPLECLECYTQGVSRVRSSFIVTVYENPLDPDPLDDTNLKNYPGIRGTITVFLKPK